MAWRIRRKLNKKERSAKARADEKSRKFYDREMMRDFNNGEECADQELLEDEFIDDDCEYIDDDYIEDDYIEDPEDYMEDEYDEFGAPLNDCSGYDDDEEEDKLTENIGIPVSLLSFLTVGGLGFLLIIMMAVYAGVMIGGRGEQPQTESQTPTVQETEEKETEGLEIATFWIQDIFGNDVTASDSEMPEIYGLSEQMKKKLQIHDEELGKDVAAFLKENGIDTELLYLEKTIPCSSESAVGYIASMAGVADTKLEMIFYPEYPDHFIFMLTEKEKVELPVSTVAVSDNGNSASANSSVPETESGASAVISQPEPVRVIYQTPETNENTYDASRLSISSIPSDLKNYIANEYLLQYQLYDYLYNKGMRNIKTAKVTEYSIDGDVRQATFRLGLDNGQTVACTYYHDSGAFSFS